MAIFNELDAVRIVKLLQPTRPFDGSKGTTRPPQVGDTGTIVTDYDGVGYCVECVSSDGMTVWLADFAPEELEPFQ